MSIIRELKQRSVFKVGIAYAVTAWVLLQLSDTAIRIFQLPGWATNLILVLLIVGFVPALILAWAFELTTDGIKLDEDVSHETAPRRKTGRKLDYVIIISLGLSLGFLLWESRFEQGITEQEFAVATVDSGSNPIDMPIRDPDKEAAVADPNSIAVLPFSNRSGDAEDIYFTDGIHEDLLTQLSRIDAFSVISRSSVMEYRDTTRNLRRIAAELRVANIVEGAVQRAGSRVRINVQLIEARTDEHLWAEIFDRELTANNLFDIQSEIAQAIAEALQATLSETELAGVAEVPTENVAAYDLYLRARQLAYNEIMDDYQTAIRLFNESLALDPDFKLAWTGLARAYMNNYWKYGGDPANRDLAREAIDRARAIDASFSELYMAEGFYWYWGHLDYERALYHLGKAIEMMPGNDEAHMWRGWVSRRAGLWEQTVDSMQRALVLNPRVHFNWHEYALTLKFLHRFDEASQAADKASELDPLSFWGKTTRAKIALQASGDIQTALRQVSDVQHNEDFNFYETFMLVKILARQYEEALSVARNFSNDLEIQRGEITLREDWAAQIHHFMGNRNESRQAAAAALFRLKILRASLGEDFRLDLAEARLSALQGADPVEVRRLVAISRASQPADNVAAIQLDLDYARIFAVAGMVPETIELLESNLRPPSETSVHTIDLDPAFDVVRDEPEFKAMLERQVE